MAAGMGTVRKPSKKKTGKKRGRKKKSQLQVLHETEQQKLATKLEDIEYYSSVGLAIRDVLMVGIALDAQVGSLRDMYECFASDVFRSMKVD